MHAPFIWDDRHEKEFNFLREDLSQPKLLHHFKPGLQIGGDVDASDSGWGGIIYNYDRSISEEPTEGNFNLLACYSAAAPPSCRLCAARSTLQRTQATAPLTANAAQGTKGAAT